LGPGAREYLIDRGPESQRTVADGHLRRDKAARLEPYQHLAPALLRLTHAVFDRQESFLAPLIDADYDQRTQLLVLRTDAGVHPIGP
jgi:hypothetical protein